MMNNHKRLAFLYELRLNISIHALNLIENEFYQLQTLRSFDATCGCQLYTSCGLVCACRLGRYINKGTLLPGTTPTFRRHRASSLIPDTAPTFRPHRAISIKPDTAHMYRHRNLKKQCQYMFVRELIRVLSGNYPMPAPNPMWCVCRCDAAQEWEEMYNEQIEWCKALRANNRENPSIEDVDRGSFVVMLYQPMDAANIFADGDGRRDAGRGSFVRWSQKVVAANEPGWGQIRSETNTNKSSRL
ncbi:hypothetical protein M8C21_024241, partial [Ambrosia artemisiifolia]